MEQLKNRNSVCISIKVEHNADTPMYNVCTREYWENGIQYMIERVENPLFFICSDNVDYVKEHYIDCEKYYVCLISVRFVKITKIVTI